MSDAATYKTLFLDQSRNHRPDPLPTPDNINGSEDLIHESDGSRIVKAQGQFVIKFGLEVTEIEAYNMLFVAESTTVPVPKVYAVYQRPEEHGVITYILMQFVPGTTLKDMWQSLGEARKTAIARTLRKYFEQLRQLPHPGYFGDVRGGPPSDEIFIGEQSQNESHKIATSLASHNDLISHIMRVYALETGERTAHKVRYYRHALPLVLGEIGDNTPTFTHNDFQRKNIMVQPDGTLVVIDWEFASWLPAYWEYATATFANGGWNDDWHDYVRVALDEYPNQALWLSNMKVEMWS